MSDGQKAAEDLTSPFWKTRVDGPTWRSMFQQQEQIKSGTITQDYGPTNDQLLQMVVVGGDILPKTKLSPDENAAHQRLRFRLYDDVNTISVNEFGGGKVPYKRRRQALMDIIGQEAWVRDAGLFGFDMNLIGTTPATPILKMTAEQQKSGFIPIEQVRKAMTSVVIDGVKTEMTWEQRLINLSKNTWQGRIPDPKDIENAYFAILAGMSVAEQERRLHGLGDK